MRALDGRRPLTGRSSMGDLAHLYGLTSARARERKHPQPAHVVLDRRLLFVRTDNSPLWTTKSPPQIKEYGHD